MNKLSERGAVHILALLILLAGIAVGVYLVQHPQIFKPKAYESTIISPCPNLTVTGIQAAFGSQRGDSRYNQCYDANNDGYVNIRDFSILRPQLSASPSPSPSPSPSTIPDPVYTDITLTPACNSITPTASGLLNVSRRSGSNIIDINFARLSGLRPNVTYYLISFCRPDLSLCRSTANLTADTSGNIYVRRAIRLDLSELNLNNHQSLRAIVHNGDEVATGGCYLSRPCLEGNYPLSSTTPTPTPRVCPTP